MKTKKVLAGCSVAAVVLVGCSAPADEGGLGLPSPAASSGVGGSEDGGGGVGEAGGGEPVFPEPTATAEPEPGFEGVPLDELNISGGDVEGFTSEQVREGAGFATVVANSLLYPMSLWHGEFTAGIPEEQRYAYPIGWMGEQAAQEWANNSLVFAPDPEYVSVLVTEPPSVSGEWVFPAVDGIRVGEIAVRSGGVDESTGFPILEVTVTVSGTAVYAPDAGEGFVALPVSKTTTLDLVQTGRQIETWKVVGWSGEPAVFGDEEVLDRLPDGRDVSVPVVTPPEPPADLPQGPGEGSLDDLDVPIVGPTPTEPPPGVEVDGPAVGSPLAAPERVDVEMFANVVRDPRTVIIDVRTAEEFAEGHIEGAVNIPVEGDGFADAVAELDPNGVYAVYCRSGNRSAAAVEQMVDAGIVGIFELESGTIGWVEAGQPLVQ